MNTSVININDLSLSYVQLNEPNVKRLRLLENRIKHFDRQISLHYNEKHYIPAKPAFELKRLRSMLDILSQYDLINTNIKIEEVKKEINQWPKIADHWESVTGLDWIKKAPRMSNVERIYLDNMELTALKSKKFERTWRLKIELEVASHKGWFIVFNTLTVRGDKRNYVFYDRTIKDKRTGRSDPIKDYIQAFDRAAGGKENHKYFGIVEYGSTTGREHYHFLHMLKSVPDDWQKDPNFGEIVPTKREIEEIKKLWEYGYSSPIAVRTTFTDAWSKVGYRWPVVKMPNGGVKPIKSGSAAKVANYVSKYIIKSLLQKEYKKWKPRLRQQLGMSIINKSLSRMTMSQLNLMLRLSRMKVLTIHYKMIPSQLLVSATQKFVTKLLIRDKQNMKLLSLEPRPSLMSVLRDSMRMKHNCNQLSSMCSPISQKDKESLYDIQAIFDDETYLQTGFIQYPDEPVIQGNHQMIR